MTGEPADEASAVECCILRYTGYRERGVCAPESSSS